MDINFDVNAVLGELAKALNTTVDYVYPILIRQAYVDAMSLAFSTLLAILVAVAITVTRSKIKANYMKSKTISCYDWESLDRSHLFVIVVIISWAIVIGLLIACAVQLPGMLINPEYYIIEKLLVTFSQM